jgi:hypothetical protein
LSELRRSGHDDNGRNRNPKVEDGPQCPVSCPNRSK